MKERTMDNVCECEVCHGPGSFHESDGRVLCVPHRREARRAGVRSTVVTSVPKHYERGPRPRVPHELHGEVNDAAAELTATDSLVALLARLHSAIDVQAANPSTPDGYPVSTPGAVERSGAPATPLDPATLVELSDDALRSLCRKHGVMIEDGWTAGDVAAALAEATSPVSLWSVESAVVARQAHSDAYARGVVVVVRLVVDAVAKLHAAAARLDELERGRIPLADKVDIDGGPKCWALARVGGYEPFYAHRVVEGENRPLGRWAYEFAVRHGRLPNLTECRQHLGGRKVYVKAKRVER